MNQCSVGFSIVPCSLQIASAILAVSLFLDVTGCLQPEIGKTKLELVQVIFRHGNRTPEYPYYGDPNAFESFHPYGWDALDKAGYQRAYNLGVYLRKLYGDFVPDDNLKEVRTWTTDIVRAKICAQLVANGMFPPVGDLKWGPPGSLGDLWGPRPYEFIPLEEDNFMYMKRKPCPAYDEEIKFLEEDPIVQSIHKKYAELINAVYTYAPPSSDDVIGGIATIYQTISIESYYNLTIPEWVKPYFPDDLLYIAIMHNRLTSWTRKMQRLRGGPLLRHIIGQMEEKQNGSTLKIGLYSGHDDTLAYLGNALRIWGDFFPDFSSAIIVELHSSTSEKYFVRTFFHNDTSKPPMQLTVPGCQKSCELREFKRILQDSIPVNHDTECLQLRSSSSAIRPPMFALISLVLIFVYA